MAAYATKSADELWNYQDQDPHRFGGVEQGEDGTSISAPYPLYLSPRPHSPTYLPPFHLLPNRLEPN